MKERSELVAQWIKTAEEDLEVARRELNYIDEEIIVRVVCYQCQQSLEKLLKAFLINSGTNFRKTHNLEELRALCGTVDEAFLNLDTGSLTDYAVEARYPGDMMVPTLDDAREALLIAQAGQSFILSRLVF